MKAKIVVLGGDGIGPEVTNEARKVLNAVAEKFGHQFEFDPQLMGGCAIDATGSSLPEATIEACKSADAILLGAVGGPKWDNPNAKDRPERGLLGLRKALNLFANLRPVKIFPQLIDASTIKPEVLAGTDMIVIRELTGGAYFGPRQEAGEAGYEAYDTMLYTRPEIERVLRVAAEAAMKRRKKLASIDKANVLASSRLWRRVAVEVLKEYPELEVEHVLVDAMAMHLIRRPASFDVMVAENLFGDILTDEAAMLAGSMGMLPSSRSTAARPTLLAKASPTHWQQSSVAPCCCVTASVWKPKLPPSKPLSTKCSTTVCALATLPKKAAKSSPLR